ncbi:MAG: alpha-D-ribose 1-methylphosphonate 5-triphosphate diphosphatase [Pseudomonadota bacterium]
MKNMSITITGGKVLQADNEWSDAPIVISGDNITRCGDLAVDIPDKAADIAIDAQGLLILPGIVDLHGDAFERQLMPRPGVHFSHSSALLETDNQMIANGITTAYHGLTYSWEPGLRGAEAARNFVDQFADIRRLLKVDTFLHLRHETYNLDSEQEIIQWITSGQVDLLAFNDHVAHIEQQLNKPEKLSVYAGRTGLNPQAFIALHQKIKSLADDVPNSIARIANAARECHIPMASHDDDSPDIRAWYEQHGCQLCEFPVDMETALYAAEKQNPVIMGAPNVMRGGSHCGRLSAVESIAAGLCTILTSDYYYPTLVMAAFKLAGDNILPLAEAWALVSKNPAAAVNKTDRGTLATGKRADILLVDAARPDLPIIRGAIVAGELVYTKDLIGQLKAA